jgi:hypothetical protein
MCTYVCMYMLYYVLLHFSSSSSFSFYSWWKIVPFGIWSWSIVSWLLDCQTLVLPLQWFPYMFPLFGFHIYLPCLLFISKYSLWALMAKDLLPTSILIFDFVFVIMTWSLDRIILLHFLILRFCSCVWWTAAQSL